MVEKDKTTQLDCRAPRDRLQTMSVLSQGQDSLSL